MERWIAAGVVACACFNAAHGQETWRRQPAVSPDGQTVLFSAHGDIWRASSDGGAATPLTTDDAWDGYPVWSRDGRRIAFASDRFGDLDVFVMDADGGPVTRLTFHDADDLPSDFSPDGARVLFSSARTDDAASSYFPTSRLPELYEVSIEGGAPRMVMTNPARDAKWSPSGDQIVYREEKAYENEWRQRDVAAFARDIWIYDVASGDHERVTDNAHGDHAPVWSPDGDALYMLSETDDAPFNVHRLDLATGDVAAVTDHAARPARELSISADGLLVYSHHGVLHRVRDGEAPAPIAIDTPTGRLSDMPHPVNLSDKVTEFAIAPSGKEIAFVARGEVFVADVEFGDTVRITDTPEQERSVSFDPDGRGLVYAAERDGAWTIYETRLDDEKEPRFSAATAWTEAEIYRAAEGEAFQPLVSPDGEKIAFIENRDAIRVIDRDGSAPRTLFAADQNYSYSDGDINFIWSPDSRWLAADYIARGYYFYTEIGVAPADGAAPPIDISRNGYNDVVPRWHQDGEVVWWFSDRYGERTHGSWGAEYDVVAAFLTQEAWDRFNLTEQERALLEEAEKERDDDEEETDEPKGSALSRMFSALGRSPNEDGEGDPARPLDFDGVYDRTARLTVHSSDLADGVISDDLKAFFYLAAFEGGYDLWKRDLVEGTTAKLASLGADSASIALLPEGEGAIVLADGRLMKTDLSDGGALKPLSLNAEMTLRADAERAHLFEHVWRQVADKFYDPAYHGLDWDALKAAYQPKVAAVSHNRDFAILMSEMLGELNASHTGMYYRPRGEREDDETAALGVIFDMTATESGLTIAEILPGGPLDKAGLDIGPGDRIVAVNGVRIDQGANPFDALNRKAGERMRLTIASDGAERAVIIRTYQRRAQNQALYERWIERRRAIVEERSNGRVGYLHILSMNDTGFRQTFSELFGRNFDKEAVVIDTRFNGGGWLHDDLLMLFAGEAYMPVRPRGRVYQGAPEERWVKSSAVVMNEGNYSNAHMFPYAYKLFEVGPLVGMPVPGTATAVWWETLISGDVFFGIPQMPALDQELNPLENQELQPDILVDNPPADAAQGLDRPLEAAVDQLLAELDGE